MFRHRVEFNCFKKSDQYIAQIALRSDTIPKLVTNIVELVKRVRLFRAAKTDKIPGLQTDRVGRRSVNKAKNLGRI